MIAEVMTGEITAVIHAGDFAYDLSSLGGKVCRRLQGLFSCSARWHHGTHVPAITCSEEPTLCA